MKYSLYIKQTDSLKAVLKLNKIKTKYKTYFKAYKKIIK